MKQSSAAVAIYTSIWDSVYPSDLMTTLCPMATNEFDEMIDSNVTFLFPHRYVRYFFPKWTYR